MTWEAKLKHWLEAIPQPQLRRLLSGLLIVLIIYLLANITLDLLPKEQSKGRWQPPKVSASSSSRQDISKLQELVLFGSADASTTAEIVPSDAPKTNLNLKLSGLAASRDPRKGSAVIESKGTQVTYGVDERIDGTRAVVKEIYPDRVMISNGGTLEALMLDDYDGARFSGSKPEEDEAPRAKKSKRDSKPKRIKPKTSSKLNDALKEMKNADGMDKLAKVSDYIKFSPVRDNGELKGFRLKPGKQREVFKATGLKSGDLAVGLNGYDLTDMSQTADVMQELKTMESLSITVDREGQLYELLLELPSS